LSLRSFLSLLFWLELDLIFFYSLFFNKRIFNRWNSQRTINFFTFLLTKALLGSEIKFWFCYILVLKRLRSLNYTFEKSLWTLLRMIWINSRVLVISLLNLLAGKLLSFLFGHFFPIINIGKYQLSTFLLLWQRGLVFKPLLNILLVRIELSRSYLLQRIIFHKGKMIINFFEGLIIMVSFLEFFFILAKVMELLEDLRNSQRQQRKILSREILSSSFFSFFLGLDLGFFLGHY
jgi:hypothetical protein